jgi:hypothetical protein
MCPKTVTFSVVSILRFSLNLPRGLGVHQCITRKTKNKNCIVFYVMQQPSTKALPCTKFFIPKAHFIVGVKAKVEPKSNILIHAKIEISPKSFTIGIKVEIKKHFSIFHKYTCA